MSDVRLLFLTTLLSLRKKEMKKNRKSVSALIAEKGGFITNESLCQKKSKGENRPKGTIIYMNTDSSGLQRIESNSRPHSEGQAPGRWMGKHRCAS